MAEPRYLLDTNICIYAIEAVSEKLREKLAEQVRDSLFLSAVSLAELAAGYDGELAEQPGVSAFLRQVPSLPFDQAAASAYGRIPFRRHRFDRLIAAHALAIGAVLVTNNVPDFADVPGLKVENWTV